MNADDTQPAPEENGAEPDPEPSVRLVYPAPEWAVQSIEGVPSHHRDPLALSSDLRADLETTGVFFGAAIAAALFVTNLRRGFRASALARSDASTRHGGRRLYAD